MMKFQLHLRALPKMMSNVQCLPMEKIVLSYIKTLPDVLISLALMNAGHVGEAVTRDVS